MNILLVIPNYKNKRYVFPLGISYVSSYLKMLKYNVTCFNANHYSDEQFEEVVRNGNFDIVGTGGIFTHAVYIKNVVNTIRKVSPKSKVILGGALPTGDPEFVYEKIKPDYLILGEGERTVGLLLQAIISNKKLSEVTGIAFEENGKLIKTPPTPVIENLDELPFPDYEGFDFDIYIKENSTKKDQRFASVGGVLNNPRTGFISTSRDCIAKCTFCFRMMGGKFRLRSMDSVRKEVNHLKKKYKINVLSVIDEMLAVKKERIIDFCNMIVPTGLYWSCQVRVSVVDDDLLRKMKESKCFQLGIGIESGSKTILKSMRKGVTPEQIQKAIKSALKIRLTVIGVFLFGDPAETIETMNESLKFAGQFSNISFGFTHILPYSGTDLYKNLVKQNKIKDKWMFYQKPLQNLYNMTSMSNLKYQYVLRKINTVVKLRARNTLGKICKLQKIRDRIYNIDIKCHICGTLNVLNNFDISCGYGFCCKFCQQQVFIDNTDIRFLNISSIIHNFYTCTVLRTSVLTPSIFYLMYPFISTLQIFNRYLRVR